MFLINFQLWAGNRKIQGAGSFYIRGSLNIRGKGLGVGVGVGVGGVGGVGGVLGVLGVLVVAVEVE